MNSFDTLVTLVKRGVQRDDYGQEIMIDIDTRQVMGIRESLSNFLYFSNATAGSKLDGVYLIHQVEYAGETVVEIDGIRYSVKRSRPFEKYGYRLVELTVGVNDGIR